MSVLVTGCATGMPSTLTLHDPQDRQLNIEAASTDVGTARRCAENMLKVSAASKATNITTHITGTGDNIVVDVSATLSDPDMSSAPKTGSYRCTYSNGIITEGRWISRLKSD